MTEISDFGAIVLLVSAGVFLAVLGMRVADRISVPNAAIFLITAGLLAASFDSFRDALSIDVVERIGVVALIVILFDGGLHIGLARFRRSAKPILVLGILGTFATWGLVALAAHYILGISWITAGLIGAAIAPTDPAVTFSVFGGREVRGRAGTILEGEAGTNDPVGIALMIGMIELATEDGGSIAVVFEEFAIEMGIGLAVGVAGAMLLLPVFRRVRLTSPALYPLRVLAGAGIIYGLASVAHGSGFLAVFVAGVLLGDVALTRKGEIEVFHSSLAALAEIAAFAALGLSVGYSGLDDATVWAEGLVLALVLALVLRPLALVPLLAPVRLRRGEKLFIVWGSPEGRRPDSPWRARRPRRGRGLRSYIRNHLRRRPVLGPGAGKFDHLRRKAFARPVPDRRPRPCRNSRVRRGRALLRKRSTDRGTAPRRARLDRHSRPRRPPKIVRSPDRARTRRPRAGLRPA